MKTILVTGGNQGIGLEICRQLGELEHHVIMGSRNLENGLKAASELRGNIQVKQLDVTNSDQIEKLARELSNEIKSLDVLINNAGVGVTHYENQQSVLSSKGRSITSRVSGIRRITKPIVPLVRKFGLIPTPKKVTNVTMEEVKEIMETNFYAPWQIIQSFFPLLRKSHNARIINISSGMGELNGLDGNYPAYRISKSALNALTIMFAKELKESGISVNAMCPGWVRTRLGGQNAPRSVSQGADTAVWLATEEIVPTGKFFRDRTQIDW